MSSMGYSWRALRLRAMVDSPMGGLLLVVDLLLLTPERTRDARRPAPLPEPALERVSSCPPAGASVRRMLPARWCNNADYCLSLHITSFRLAKPYMTTRDLARAPSRQVL